MKEYKLNNNVSVILSDRTWQKVVSVYDREIRHFQAVYDIPEGHPQYDVFACERAVSALSNRGRLFAACIAGVTGYEES